MCSQAGSAARGADLAGVEKLHHSEERHLGRQIRWRRAPVESATHQHRMARRCGQPETASDLRRAEMLARPQMHDPLHDGLGSLVRVHARSARAINHPSGPS